MLRASGKSLDEQLSVEGGSLRPRGWGGRMVGRVCKREKWRKQESESDLLLRGGAEVRREQSRGDGAVGVGGGGRCL